MRVREFINNSQNDLRIKLWKIGGRVFKDNPLKGVGNGNSLAYYDIYVKKYPELKCIDHWRYPLHNSYLKVLSELGILGFIPFMGIMVSAFLMDFFNINFPFPNHATPCLSGAGRLLLNWVPEYRWM